MVYNPKAVISLYPFAEFTAKHYVNTTRTGIKLNSQKKMNNKLTIKKEKKKSF